MSALASAHATVASANVGGRRPAPRRSVSARATPTRAGKLGDTPVSVAVRTSQGEVIDCFTALMRNRIIFIQERVDEDVATRVCAELLALQYLSLIHI